MPVRTMRASDEVLNVTAIAAGGTNTETLPIDLTILDLNDIPREERYFNWALYFNDSMEDAKIEVGNHTVRVPAGAKYEWHPFGVPIQFTRPPVITNLSGVVANSAGDHKFMYGRILGVP